MADKLVGKLVQVNSTTARNPGGYGRIVRKGWRLYRVEAFPGQEVTGWYTRGELIILNEADFTLDMVRPEAAK